MRKYCETIVEVELTEEKLGTILNIDRIRLIPRIYDTALICVAADEDGSPMEYLSSELPDIYQDNENYDIIGYICPECGEPVYADPADEDDRCGIACPVCEFEFDL